MAKQEYDAIVVGSGMTGGWAAKELTERGLKVLLLERGRNVRHGVDYTTEHKPESAFPFRGQGDRRETERDYPVQSQHWVFHEATKHFLINDRLNPYTTDPETPFSWIRGWQVGGRSLLWSRQCLRLTDLNFEANARDGIAIDWPIRFKDLEPWYNYVESFVGISAEAGVHPSIPAHPQPPLPLNVAERHLQRSVAKTFADRLVTASPQAVLTQDHNGRMACHHCGPCERGCSSGAYFSSQSATLPAARATGNLTLRTDSIVHSVSYDEKTDRVTGVLVIDAKTGKSHEYSARLVFLCASAMESVRLLLNSATSRFAEGLANSSGVLGHYLIDHATGAGASGVLPDIGNGGRYYNGHSPGMFYIPRFQNIADKHPDFIRGYHMNGNARLPGWRRAIGGTGVGAALKQTLQDPGSWNIDVSGQGECLPIYENRMTLSQTVKDAWGIPVPHFHFAWGENETKMRASMAEAAAEMLESAGVRNIKIFNRPRVPGNDNHEMGGARMGRDPKTSVLNAYNQSHDIPNLFITDGACMTSSANQNPSLTYMALTARACDYAVRQMKRGEI